MITGAQAEPQAESHGNQTDHPDWLGPPIEEDAPIYADEARPARGRTVLAAALIVAALGWIGASVWSALQQGVAPTLPAITAAIALASAPLILIGLLWLIFGRSSRRESERFTHAVAQMHRESVALESILAIVSTRLEENHARLSVEAAKLMAMGDEAADRLGRVAHYLSKESAGLDKRAEQLESAANMARVDIGVLLHDLPRAEEQARAVAEAMKDAGFLAHAETGQLESQLSALVARGREADEVVGGAAQRLAAHLVRIETSTAAAQTQLGDAAVSMTTAVDDTMARTADAVEAARSGLEAQGQATLAMIEQSRAALEQAGEASGRNLANRLEAVSGQIERLANHLAAQDAASQTLVGRLGADLADLDARFAALGESGATGSAQLSQSIEAVRAGVQQLHAELGSGQDRAAELIGRTHELAGALTGVTQHLQGELPAALDDIESRADRARAAADNLMPVVEAVQVAACDAAAQAAAAEASIARQQGALVALIERLRDSVAGTEEQLRALGAATGEADGNAARLVHDTGPELVETLLRVREAAAQAAASAREAIAAVIPQAASELGEASRLALSEAIAGTVETQVGELAALSERAVEAARAASERLTRQMLAIGETASAVEARIDAARSEREEQDSESFARRVALLIESLNSTAIDVTKILSNDVTDSAWAGYLKGDRGVFTRRAVRLLDNAEVREIVAHYEGDAEFRGQVNRYIHDFEAMLRRVLADRDGSALGITILSSDMGKLYVALAQAIERLRN